jgi:hypothetical protein
VEVNPSTLLANLNTIKDRSGFTILSNLFQREGYQASVDTFAIIYLDYLFKTLGDLLPKNYVLFNMIVFSRSL